MPDFPKQGSSEEWRQAKQVNFPEVTITVAGEPGEQTLHTVSVGKKCRVMELSMTHVGTAHTKIQIIQNITVMITILCPPQSSRLWGSQTGRTFESETVIKVRSSNVVGGTTFISGSGLEA